MRVLIACEFSGVVRRAFRDRGNDAWSLDLLPAEDGSEFHFMTDAARFIQRKILGPWDLLIAHPPCTYLANSGNKHLYIDPDREANAQLAADFFKVMLNADIPQICVENPIMRQAVARVGRKQDQVIQPWMFGHGETKATCLWLKGLPKLVPTKIVEGREPKVHFASPGPDRWKERSRTLPGIADAMADQWGHSVFQKLAAE